MRRSLALETEAPSRCLQPALRTSSSTLMGTTPTCPAVVAPVRSAQPGQPERQAPPVQRARPARLGPRARRVPDPPDQRVPRVRPDRRVPLAQQAPPAPPERLPPDPRAPSDLRASSDPRAPSALLERPALLPQFQAPPARRGSSAQRDRRAQREPPPRYPDPQVPPARRVPAGGGAIFAASGITPAQLNWAKPLSGDGGNQTANLPEFAGSPMIGSCTFDTTYVSAVLVAASGQTNITVRLLRNGAVAGNSVTVTNNATVGVLARASVSPGVRVVAGDVVGLSFTQTNGTPIVRFGVTTRCQ